MPQRIILTVKSFAALLGFVVMCASVFGAPRKVDLQLESLQLKNGRVFGETAVKSYDHETGSVILLSDRSLTSVQLELLPDEVAARVMSLVPTEEKALARDERLAQETERRIARLKAEAAARKSELARQGRSGAAQMELEAQRERQKIERVKAAARNSADHYFRYDFIHGASTYVFSTDIELDEPEPVSGWPDRYRVCGRAGIRYYVSKGSSLNTAARRFEVTLQADDKGYLKTVDFTCN